MENKTTTKTSKWQPNEKQKDFLEILGNYTEPVTLAQIESDTGKKFATGTINTLVSRGLVTTTDTEIEFVEVLASDHNKIISGVRRKTVKAWAKVTE